MRIRPSSAPIPLSMEVSACLTGKRAHPWRDKSATEPSGSVTWHLISMYFTNFLTSFVLCTTVREFGISSSSWRAKIRTLFLPLTQPPSSISLFFSNAPSKCTYPVVFWFAVGLTEPPSPSIICLPEDSGEREDSRITEGNWAEKVEEEPAAGWEKGKGQGVP